MAIIKKAKNINIQVANNYTSISKISHEQSEEVIIEATKKNLELSSQKRAIMQGFGKDNIREENTSKNKVKKIVGFPVTWIYEWMEYSVTEYAFPPTNEDKQKTSWMYEDSNGIKKELKTKGEKLKIFLANPDDFGKKFRIFAYIKELSEDVVFTSDVVGELNIHKRSSWNARPPQLGGNFSYERIKGTPSEYFDTIVIHHSGNLKHFPTIREIQNEHMDQKGKADIGYHFAVDKYGIIYEGRPINIKGAHVDKANTSKIGIVLLADLSSDNAGMGIIKKKIEEYNGDDYLTDKMELSLLRLCVYLDKEYGTDKVGGHMEIATTSNSDERYCPGNITMAKMNYWRTLLVKLKP